MAYKTKKNTHPDSPRNCRGYPGYFMLKGKRTYLRSTKEFIVASWLNSIGYIDKIVTEPIYEQYKPDFLIYVRGEPRTVIEVKDNKKAAEEYINKYRGYFRDLGLRYIVIYSAKHFSKLTKKTGLSEIDIQSWKNTSNYDYSGANNPRFGMKATEETKRKIGNKAAARGKDPLYCKGISERITEYMNLPGVRESISKTRLAYYAIENPKLLVPCDNCSKLVSTTKVKHENRVAKKGYFICSASCACTILANRGDSRKFTTEESHGRFKTRLLFLGKKLIEGGFDILEKDISDAKLSDFIYRKSPISVGSITTYFGSVENFKKEIMND